MATPRTLLTWLSLSLVTSVHLEAQLPTTNSPVCLRLSYDSLAVGMKLADLPTRLELGAGDHGGSVRAPESTFADTKLRKGQEWSLSKGREGSYTYDVTLGGHGIILAYLLTLHNDTLTGNLTALYVDTVAHQAHQRFASLVAVTEPCPAH